MYCFVSQPLGWNKNKGKKNPALDYKQTNMGFGANKVVSYFHDQDVGNFHYGMHCWGTWLEIMI